MISKNNPFIQKFEQKVKNTIKQFNLISKKDKLLVACSGGKDSTTILYILNKLGYNVEAITVNASIGNYTKKNLENLRKFCKQHSIRIHEFSFRKEIGYSLCYIKSILKQKGINLNSCTLCGVLRRHLLNKYARKLKATKIVTGHNLNDEAQSIIMNLFKNNLEILTKIGPSTGVIKNEKFIPRVKPLYIIPEKEIKQYSKLKKFPVNYDPCPCRTEVYRYLMNKLLIDQEKEIPRINKNIINWFLSISHLLKKHYKIKEKQNYCKNCAEPSKKEICMTCQILENIK